MRPLSVSLRGITRYAEPLTLDLRGLPDGIIALVGDNGAGKTTLLEALGPAPIYRGFVTYPGTLLSSVRPDARDAYIDLRVEYGGHEYRHLLTFDAPGQKSEATLYRDGVPVSERRAGDYDEAIAQAYPPRDLFLAGAFSAQDRQGDWLGLDRKGRRDVFATLLGLGALQAQSEAARERGRSALAQVEALEVLLASEPVADVQALEVEVALAQAELAAAESEVETYAGALDRLAQEGAAAAAGLATVEAARRRVLDRQDRARGALSTAEATLSRVQTQIAQTEDQRRRLQAERARLGDPPADPAALWTPARVAREQEQAQAAVVSALLERRAAWATWDTREAARSDVLGRRRLDEGEQRALEEKHRADGGEDVTLTAAGTAPLLEAAGSLAASRRDQVVALVTAHRDHADRRRQAARLEAVPCRGERMLPVPGSTAILEPVDCGTCPLIADARQAASLLGSPPDPVEPAMLDRERAETRLTSIRETISRLSQLDATLAGLPPLPVPDGSREGLTEDALSEARAELARRAQEAQAADRAVTTAQEAHARYTQTSARLAQDEAATAATLVQLQTQAAEARAALDHARQEHDLALAEVLADLDAPTTRYAELRARYAQARADAQARDQRRQAARSKVESKRQQMERETEARQLRETRAMRTASLRGDVRAWGLLERGLGRDGLQALEIDRSGPEVTALLNELLAEVWGPRLRAELRTQADRKAGAGSKEVFDLVVYDRGDARPVERFSVGERALVSEALRLAIAIYSARRSPHPIRTLYRDECDGALQADLAERYPEMLRRALSLGGYERVYLISHRESVWSQADARIRLSGGTAAVEVG